MPKMESFPNSNDSEQKAMDLSISLGSLKNDEEHQKRTSNVSMSDVMRILVGEFANSNEFQNMIKNAVCEGAKIAVEMNDMEKFELKNRAMLLEEETQKSLAEIIRLEEQLKHKKEIDRVKIKKLIAEHKSKLEEMKREKDMLLHDIDRKELKIATLEKEVDKQKCLKQQAICRGNILDEKLKKLL